MYTDFINEEYDFVEAALAALPDYSIITKEILSANRVHNSVVAGIILACV